MVSNKTQSRAEAVLAALTSVRWNQVETRFTFDSDLSNRNKGKQVCLNIGVAVALLGLLYLAYRTLGFAPVTQVFIIALAGCFSALMVFFAASSALRFGP